MRQGHAYIIIFIISVCLFRLQNKSFAGESPDAKPPAYNVVLIVVDSLRADHLSCYGYFRNTSPNIDKFALGSILFEEAISQANNTLLSFASILTSQYVSTHKVRDFNRRLNDSALTLAEVLKIYNYRTAAFVGGFLLDPVFGLDQGFDTYYHLDKTGSSFKDVIPPALKWIEERKKDRKKFFLLLHGNDLHPPYLFPKTSMYDKGYNGQIESINSDGKTYWVIYKKMIHHLYATEDRRITYLNPQDIRHIIAEYDEGINYVDNFIGDFLKEFDKLRLRDKTVIILTADHGEGLFDHDYFFHDFNLYENTIRVPLIIRIPPEDARVRKISRQVQLIDLMPTILELAGIRPNQEAEGHSILSLLTGEAGPKFNQYVFSESHFAGAVIRSDEWKLIYYPDTIELYNLKEDRQEKQNLFKRRPDIAGRLTAELLGWMEERRGCPDSSEGLKKKPGFREALEDMEKTNERMRKEIPKKFSLDD